MRICGGGESTFLNFLIALGDLLLLVFQEFFEIGRILSDGIGLRRVIERKQIRVGDAERD